METGGIAVVVVGVGAVCVAGYAAYAVSLSRDIRSTRQFFLHTGRLGERDLSSTFLASWMMLSSVVVSVLILGLVAGIANIWTVGTWALGFVILGRHAERIRDLTHREGVWTLHSFLGRRFRSRSLQVLASGFTVFAGLGAFALELIIGIAVLQIIPGFMSSLAGPVIASLALTGILAFYAARGGFEAVIRTDRMQALLLTLGLVGMGALIAQHIVRNPESVGNIPRHLYWPKTAEEISLLWSATGPAFFVGLLCLQLFLMLGDMGSWQRIIASRSEIRPRRALKKVAFWTAALWTLLVGVGVLLWTHPSPEGLFPNPENILATQAEPLPSVIGLAAGSVVEGLGWIGGLLVGMLAAGLVSAMLSTADTFLVVIMQTLTQDVVFSSGEASEGKELSLQRGGPEGDRDGRMLRFARKYIYVVALAGVVLFWSLIPLGFDLLTLVFVVFGAQAALAPISVVALSGDLTLRNYRRPALGSAVGAFLMVMVAGFYAASVGAPVLSLWAPAVGVLVPTVALSFVGWHVDRLPPSWLVKRMVLGDYREVGIGTVTDQKERNG